MQLVDLIASQLFVGDGTLAFAIAKSDMRWRHGQIIVISEGGMHQEMCKGRGSAKRVSYAYACKVFLPHKCYNGNKGTMEVF